MTVCFSVPACMVIFGSIAMAQGFVKNYRGLLVTRFLLGLSEASVDPGCLYLIAMYVSAPLAPEVQQT